MPYSCVWLVLFASIKTSTGAYRKASIKECMARNRWWRYALLCVPTFLAYGLFPWVNRVEPWIAGIPFFWVWVMMCIVLTWLVLYIFQSTSNYSDDTGEFPLGDLAPRHIVSSSDSVSHETARSRADTSGDEISAQ